MDYTFIAPQKSPAGDLDYSMSWDDWLAEGETITAFAVICQDDTITLDRTSASATDVRWWLTGGVKSRRYSVAVTIVTSAGRSDVRTVLVAVGDR